jgi:hypothetical protein
MKPRGKAKKSAKEVKRIPTMRFKFDGSWWKVKIQRPPEREVLEGLVRYDTRTIYLDPRAVACNGFGIIVHEVAHAVLRDIAEDPILELERISSAVAKFVAKYTKGTISIGRHKAVE